MTRYKEGEIRDWGLEEIYARKNHEQGYSIRGFSFYRSATSSLSYINSLLFYALFKAGIHFLAHANHINGRSE